MATLKGQNFRVGILNASEEYQVVAMATNCTITLNSNTEDASTKDDVGMASKPTVVSKSWSVQVESFDVVDVGTFLTAIKSNTQFSLIWDETATSDNYTSQKAAFSRKGLAYCNDATFTFDDRANSVKQLQFTGIGALSTITNGDIMYAATTSTYTKGQFVRLFLGSDNTTTPVKVIGAAKQLSLHVSVSLEDSTTKDTDGGDWQVQEPTALSYDISTTALVRSGDTITSATLAQGLSDLETIYESSSPVKWQIANVSGANQRTKGSVIVSGSVIIQTLTMNNPNRQNSTYTAQLQGVGQYTVGS